MAQSPSSSPQSLALRDYEYTIPGHDGMDPRKINLSVSVVQHHFLRDATQTEALTFIAFCRNYRLDPWLKEVYLIRYQAGQPANIVIAYDTFVKRAEDHSAYTGFSAGIVIERIAGEPAEEFEGEPGLVPKPFKALDGMLVPTGYQLVGGWCRVHRTDRPRPQVAVVALKEYQGTKSDGTVTKMWSQKQATMIRKTAIARGHREAFPTSLAHWYIDEELRHQGADDAKRVEGTEVSREPLPAIPDALVPLFDQLDWNEAERQMYVARCTAEGKTLAEMQASLEAELPAPPPPDEAGDAETGGASADAGGAGLPPEPNQRLPLTAPSNQMDLIGDPHGPRQR